MNNLLLRIPQKFWAYLALSAWGILSYLLLNKTQYGVDEGAARALLLVWSVAEGIVSPVVTLGLPDFRSLFFVPVGYLWPGNIVAAKIFSLLMMASAVWAIFRWRQDDGHAESALISSGLLLISPLLIDQIDAIAVIPYVLVTFSLGAWLDRIYRETPHPFGGVYFFQLLLCLVSVSLHPAGLAYPLALLWAWYKNPTDERNKKYFLVGVIFTIIVALLLTMGWGHIEWFTNPFRSMSGLLMGSPVASSMDFAHWFSGIAIVAVIAFIIWKQFGHLMADILGRTFLIAFAIGLMAGDETWAMISLVIGLYWGFPMVLKSTENPSSGFLGQRGLAMSIILVMSTLFMLFDKAHYQRVLVGHMSARDSLIKTLAEDSEIFSSQAPKKDTGGRKPLRIASQWPGLTMLACRCDALPLPPAAKDSETLLAMLRGIDYLIFDPSDQGNKLLSRNLATIDAGKVETISLQSGGVIIEIKRSSKSLPL